MTKNITQMLRDRQLTGKKLNKHKTVFPNRYEAYYAKNRKVREDLQAAHHVRRIARQQYEHQNSMLADYIRRGRPAATIQSRMSMMNAAEQEYQQSRRAYDSKVEEANEVLKEWELFQQHYSNPLQWPALNPS